MTNSEPLLPSQGEALLSIDFADTPSTEQLEQIAGRLDAFFVAANAGMFCGVHYPPEQSHVVVTEMILKSRQLQRRFEFRAIDQGAFRILRGLLFYFSVYNARIERATATLQNDYLSDLLQQPRISLPSTCRSPGFSVLKHEPARINKWRLVHIEIQEILDQKQQETLLEQLSSWEEICCGGYAEDILHPEQSGIAPGDLYFVDPFIIEYGIDYILVDEAAFNGLINIATKIHRTTCRVRGIEMW